MKSLLRIAAAALLAVTFTGCSLNELAKIEPADWERNQFEQRVSRSLARAASAPGIDNGSTIIVTSKGDTLLAPTDSTLASSQVRTVYVDVHTTYPHAISSRVVDMVGIFSAIGVIAAMVLLILLGVFVVVIRRQHGRNKLISRAIAEGYQLPESFFTGVPASPQVTVVNETVRETVRECHEDRDVQPAQHLAVFIIKHFITNDASGLLAVKRFGHGPRGDFFRKKPVHGKSVAKLGDLPLKFVQHGGREMGFSKKPCGK